MASVSGELKQWHAVTIDFQGPYVEETPSTFRDYRLNVTFTNQDTGEVMVVPGYFAADGDAANTSATEGDVWRVKFTPPSTGNWTYEASFRTGEDVAVSLDPTAGTATSFDGDTGSLAIVETDKTGEDLRAHGTLQADGDFYLNYAGSGDVFIKSGVGGPESFLSYTGFDNTESKIVQGTDINKDYDPHIQDFNEGDPTWGDGQGEGIIGAVNYLGDTGINAIYLVINSIAGDSQNIHPWSEDLSRIAARDVTGHDPALFQSFDVSKLAQWDIVFQHMEEKGIAIQLLFGEAENQLLLNNGEVGLERQLFIREIVARFGHNNSLMYNFGEEFKTTTIGKTHDTILDHAAYFNALDAYDHPLAIHTNPGTTNTRAVLEPELEQDAWDVYSAQQNDGQAIPAVIEWRQKYIDNGTPTPIHWDEAWNARAGFQPDTNPEQQAEQRAFFWGVMLNGAAGVSWYPGFGDDLHQEDFRKRDIAYTWTVATRKLFEQLPLNDMNPEHDVTSATNDYVFALLGEIYIIYLPNGGGSDLDLTGYSGEYEVTWFNPRADEPGHEGTVTAVQAGGVVDLGLPPFEGTEDWTIIVRQAGEYRLEGIDNVVGNEAPIASDDIAETVGEDPVSIDVLANDTDPDASTPLLQSVADPAGGTSVIVDGQIVYTPDPGFSGVDTFEYTIVDPAGATSTGVVTVNVIQESQVGLIGQTGEVTVAQDSASQWHAVAFDIAMIDPIVVGTVVTLNDADPVHVRLRNVTETGFEFQLEEWTYQDGIHGAETISWTAVERGVHTLTDGAVIQAGSASVDDTAVDISFGQAYADAPVVIGQFASEAGGDPSTDRVSGVTATGFTTRLQEDEANGPHTLEDFHWIAFESGTHESFSAAIVNTGDATASVALDPTYDGVVLADIQTINEADTASARADVSGATADVFVQEEQAADNETTHAAEQIGVVQTNAILTTAAFNVAPSANNDTAATTAPAPVTIDVLANDSDPDGDALTLLSVSDPANGTAVIDGGQIVYTPDAGFAGTETFTYTVEDALGASSTASVSVVVTAANVAPLAVGDTASTDFGEAVTIDVLANDSDPDGGALTLASVEDPANGTAVIDGGQIIYTPDAGFSGSETFDYTITDPDGATSTATITVDVADEPVTPPLSDTPANAVAAFGSTSFDEVDAVSGKGAAVIRVLPGQEDIQLSNFGANSFTIENVGDKRIVGAYIDVEKALYGDAVFDPDGTGGDNVAKPLQINMIGGTDVVAPGTYTHLFQATDNADDPLFADGLTQNNAQGGFRGLLLKFNADGVGGFSTGETVGFSIDMDPNSIAGWNKGIVDTLSFPTWDVGGISGAELIGSEVTILFADGTTSTSQLMSDGSQAGSQALISQDLQELSASVTVNGAAPGETGTYDGQANVVVEGPAGATIRVVLTKGIQPAQNTAQNVGANVDARLADEDFAVNNAIEFQVVDITLGAGETSRDISDLFTYDNDPNGYAFEGNDQLPLGFVASVIDPANQDLALGPVSDAIYLTYEEQATPPAPAENLIVNGSFEVDEVTRSQGNQFFDDITGWMHATEAELQENGFAGVTASDGDQWLELDTRGFNLEAVYQDVETVAGQTYALSVDGAQRPNFPDNTVEVYWSGELVGSFTAASSSFETFTFEVTGTGGSDRLEFRELASESEGAGALIDNVVLTVAGDAPEPNAAPVAANDLASTDANQSITIDVLGNDSDPDGDALSIQSVDDPANGTVAINSGQIVYTPDAGFSGTETFSYTIADPDGATSTATVTLDVSEAQVGNAAPVTANDTADAVAGQAVTIDVLANDSDPEGGALTLQAVANPVNGSAVIAGNQIIYTADAGFTGTETFNYTVADDQGALSAATVTVTVAVDEPPAPAENLIVNGSFENPEVSSTLHWGRFDSIAGWTTPTAFEVQKNGIAFGTTATDGDQWLELDAGHQEVDSLSQDVTTQAGVEYDLSLDLAQRPGVSANTVEIYWNGVLVSSVDPNSTTFTTYSFTVIGTGGSDRLEFREPSSQNNSQGSLVDNVVLTIAGGEPAPNAAPIAADDLAATDEGQAITIDVLGNDSDADGDALVIQSVATPANGTAVVFNGAIVYTPNAGFSGTETLDYTVSDPAGATATGSVTVNVASNAAPVAVNDTATTPFGRSIAVDVLENDSDPDGDALSLQSVANPANGTASIVNGAIFYTPDAGFSGTETFAYTIADDLGKTATGTVTIEVDEQGPVQSGNLLINGSFEDNEVTSGGNFQFFNNLAGWTHPNAAELQENSGRFSVDASDGTQWLEIDADSGGGNVDSIYQDVQTVAGQSYELSVDAAWRGSRASSSVEVYWAGNLVDVIEPASGTTFQTYTFSLTGTGGLDRLEFREPAADNNGKGSYIDNVILTTDGAVPTNAAPIAVGDTAATDEGQSIIIDVLENDSDPDNDSLSLASVSPAANGQTSIQGNQVLYTPDFGFSGQDSFDYTIIDTAGNISTATVALTVEAEEQPEEPEDGALTLLLVNAGTEQVLDDITDGVINPALLDGSPYSIEARYEGDAGSILFTLSTGYSRTESVAPYSLYGDIGGDFFGRALPNESFNGTVTVFEGPGGSGAAIAEEDFLFTFSDLDPA